MGCPVTKITKIHVNSSSEKDEEESHKPHADTNIVMLCSPQYIDHLFQCREIRKSSRLIQPLHRRLKETAYKQYADKLENPHLPITPSAYYSQSDYVGNGVFLARGCNKIIRRY